MGSEYMKLSFGIHVVVVFPIFNECVQVIYVEPKFILEESTLIGTWQLSHMTH